MLLSVELVMQVAAVAEEIVGTGLLPVAPTANGIQVNSSLARGASSRLRVVLLGYPFLTHSGSGTLFGKIGPMPDDKTTQALIDEIKLLRRTLLVLAAAQYRVMKPVDATKNIEALWDELPNRRGLMSRASLS
jgi:hypothetical protein